MRYRELSDGARYLQSGLATFFFLKDVASASPSSSAPKLKSFVSLQTRQNYIMHGLSPRLLLCTLSSLPFFPFACGRLACLQLCTLLLCGNAGNDILEWVLDDAHCPNFRWVEWLPVSIEFYKTSVSEEVKATASRIHTPI